MRARLVNIEIGCGGKRIQIGGLEKRIVAIVCVERTADGNSSQFAVA